MHFTPPKGPDGVPGHQYKGKEGAGGGQQKTGYEGEKCEEAERQMKRNGTASRLNHLEVLIS